MEVRIYTNGSCFILGSIHKYYNNGIHNYNDFDFKNFNNSINELLTVLKIKSIDCKLCAIEIGLNIIPVIPTNTFLDNCFLHSVKPFKELGGKARYKQSEHSQYKVKIYNKALQYNCKSEILRFELKFIKMQRINKLGYYTLNDISNKGFKPFGIEIIKEFENLLYYDSTLQNINESKLLKYSNPSYWRSIAINQKSLFRKNKRELIQMVSNSSEQIKEQTKHKLINKIADLS